MNNSTISAAALDALQTRFGLQVAACLTERTAMLPHDVSERLRVARERAVERARLARVGVAATGTSIQTDASGSMTLGRSGQRQGWWVWLGSAMPIVALVAGLLIIQRLHEDSQITAAAEIDAALLADDLPPTAYSDPGFAEFLKSPRN